MFTECTTCGTPLTGGFTSCDEHELIKVDEFLYTYGNHTISWVSGDRWEVRYKDIPIVFYATSPENARICILASAGSE